MLKEQQVLQPFGPSSLKVFSRSEVRLSGWHRFLGQICSGALPYSFDSAKSAPIASAEDVHTALEGMPSRDLLNAVVVVDLLDEPPEELSSFMVEPADTSALERYKGGFRIPELVLAFPEVYWIFVVPGQLANVPHDIFRFHFLTIGELAGLVPLLMLHAAGYREWFDPGRLREWLRSNTNRRANERQEQSGGASNFSSSSCEESGISIDDEPSYCLLGGYLHYRHGRSTYVVNSHSEMKRVLSSDRIGVPYVLADVELQFDDAPIDDPRGANECRYLVSNQMRDVKQVLAFRLQRFPVLQESRTAGRLYWVSGIARPNEVGAVPKPYLGMFDRRLRALWNRNGNGSSAVMLVRRALEERRVHEVPGVKLAHKHHSAPYRSQHVAERMLRRARVLEVNAISTVGALQIALLARDARLLLGNLTPSLSLEALAIQYRMEVVAECAFPGGAPSLAPKARLASLTDEAHGLAPNLKQANNSLVAIISDLHARYRMNGQHVAADVALDKLRSRRWHLQYASTPFLLAAWALVIAVLSPLLIAVHTARAVLQQLAAPAEAYFNYLMRSFANIVIVSTIWVLAFGWIYLNTVRCDPNSACRTFTYTEWVYHSASTFLALQPGISGAPAVMQLPSSKVTSMRTVLPNGGEAEEAEAAAQPMVLLDRTSFRTFWLLTIAEMCVGFLHIGILISFLFQKLSR